MLLAGMLTYCANHLSGPLKDEACRIATVERTVETGFTEFTQRHLTRSPLDDMPD